MSTAPLLPQPCMAASTGAQRLAALLHVFAVTFRIACYVLYGFAQRSGRVRRPLPRAAHAASLYATRIIRGGVRSTLSPPEIDRCGPHLCTPCAPIVPRPPPPEHPALPRPPAVSERSPPCCLPVDTRGQPYMPRATPCKALLGRPTVRPPPPTALGMLACKPLQCFSCGGAWSPQRMHGFVDACSALQAAYV